MHQRPGGLRFLEGRQIAANHLLCKPNDALQSAPVLGAGGSEPNGDGGGQDGLSDGSVESSPLFSGSSAPGCFLCTISSDGPGLAVGWSGSCCCKGKRAEQKDRSPKGIQC